MRRKEREVLENVKIEAIAAEGKAIAHINGKVLFVPLQYREIL
jgi:tRNA/tmRNA/rRNA uracil-C5-methylase (TrmA/RlmC/RlmD family)